MKDYLVKAKVITKWSGGFLILPSILLFASCEDFVTVPSPTTELIQNNVFKNETTALSAIASVYNNLSELSSFAGGGNNSITIFEGLYADELNSFLPSGSSSSNAEFYSNNVSPLNGTVSSTWSNSYRAIYECNRILEGLNSSEISLPFKNQLSGEALFIRAFCHFYLVNLFGDVPLITSSDYRVNTRVSRRPIAQVYAGIINDLLEAKELLSDNYPSLGRVRVNKGATIAMLARVYLYAGDFIKAEAAATDLIAKTNQYKLHNDLDSVFLKSSEEAIWQLLPRGGQQNYTNEGFYFILLAPPTNWALSDELYQSFETGDLRRINWIGSIKSSSGLTTWYFPYKYKERSSNATGVELSMVLRTAEQYLIRAEARAQQGNLTDAEADLSKIRTRVGLPNIELATKDQLLSAIEHERRVEFFSEWGHRFFDLKRTGRLDDVLGPMKSNWDSNDALLPLPQNELLLNQNLRPQNPGY